MSDKNLVEGLLYLAVGGGTLAVYAYKQIKKKTHIKNTAKQIISSASAGSVEIEGVAWPLRATSTSLKGEQIVFRHITLQKYVKQGKSGHWKTVWAKGSEQPFLVFDHSGLMIINPATLNSEDSQSLEDLTSTKYTPGKLTSSQEESFNEFYDHSVSGFSTSKPTGFISSLFSNSGSFRIIELTIPVGCPLLIHGYLTPQDSFRFIHVNDDFKVFKERVSKLLKSKNLQLKLFDKDHDGSIDAKELFNGFRSTLKGSTQKNIGITDFKTEGLPNEKVYGTIGGNASQELRLADCFEEQILRSKPLYLNWLCLYLGAGLIALAVFLFMVLVK